MLVRIDGEEYQRAVVSAASMVLPSKVGGRLNTAADPYQSKRIGVLGEMAFAGWLGIRYEFSPKTDGDGGIDFDRDGTTIDVKTASLFDSDECLVKCTGVNAVPHTLADIYVCGILRREHRSEGLWEDDGWGDVDLIGWTTRETVQQAPLSPARWANPDEADRWATDPMNCEHMNYVVPHSVLRPMDELMDELDRRRDGH